MRYVTVESTEDGFSIDTRPWLAWLDAHVDELPPGAQAVARDPEHRDIWHAWSPRLTKFESLTSRHTDDGAAATLVMSAFGQAVDRPRYVVRYEGVSRIEVDGNLGERGPASLLAYEVVAHPDGVEHGLDLIGGTITVVARDLTAGWFPRGSDEGLKDDRARIDMENPATLVRLMRLYPRMCVLDDRFITMATVVRHRSDLRLNEGEHPFQDWVSHRLLGGTYPPAVVWEQIVMRHVAPGVAREEWTPEHDAAATTLMFDLLEEYLADQGYVALTS